MFPNRIKSTSDGEKKRPESFMKIGYKLKEILRKQDLLRAGTNGTRVGGGRGVAQCDGSEDTKITVEQVAAHKVNGMHRLEDHFTTIQNHFYNQLKFQGRSWGGGWGRGYYMSRAIMLIFSER